MEWKGKKRNGNIEEVKTPIGVSISAGIKLWSNYSGNLESFPKYLEDSVCYQIPRG